MMRLVRLVATVRLRLRSLFRRGRVERDLDDELRDHLERRIQAGVERGLSPAEARTAALRAFGGIEPTKEACRDVRRTGFVDALARDVRSGLRHFGRTPLVAATVVFAFALGIGFNTAFFLLIQAFVNGPVPGVPREEGLVRIRGIDRTRPGRAIGREFSYPEYREYVALESYFSDVAAWTSSDAVLGTGTGKDDLHSGAATYVTSNYFRVLGLSPALGGGLPIDAADDGAPVLAAVISYALWERHFGKAPDVTARTITVNGFAVPIVGVAPRRFAGARTGGSQMRVWIPLSARAHLQRTGSILADYDDARLGIVARLQPDVDAEDAGAAVGTIATRVAGLATRGPSGRAAAADVVPLLADNYFPPSGAAPDGAAGRYVALLFPLFILLIPCTSASALIAGLAITRRREIAVRLALGAGRPRVVRQLVTESVLLAVVAGAVGLFVIRLLVALFDASIPNLAVEFDWRGFAFTFGLGVVTGILFGISPALAATRIAPAGALKDSAGVVAPTRLRLQAWLVVAQIAVTQPALLMMGALLLEMRAEIAGLPAQAHAERILVVRFNTNPRYGAMDEGREETLRRVQARLAAVPGVVAVVPQESGDESLDVEVHPADRADDSAAQARDVRVRAAPPGYFDALGLSFVRGRDFEPSERAADGAIVISTNLARRLWGAGDPIGRRLVTTGPEWRGTATFTVVGVVESAGGMRPNGPRDVPIFVPRLRTTAQLLVRTEGPAQEAVSSIRAAAADEAPELPVVATETLAAMEASERGSLVSAAAVAGGVGGLALLLSAIGLYAVAAVAVGQRAREIGIRTALGADSRQVVRLFVRQGLWLSLTGLALGLPLGILGERQLTVGGAQPAGVGVVTVLVAGVVVAVALVASWIPARHAARVDPLEALRAE